MDAAICCVLSVAPSFVLPAAVPLTVSNNGCFAYGSPAVYAHDAMQHHGKKSRLRSDRRSTTPNPTSPKTSLPLQKYGGVSAGCSRACPPVAGGTLFYTPAIHSPQNSFNTEPISAL